MKKHLLSAIILQMIMIASYAQIPNASFENWTGGNPDNWLTGNSGSGIFITQDNTAHDGSSAAKSSTITIFNVTISSPLVLGNTGQGAHTNTAPQAIHGWYILNSVANDYFWSVAAVVDNTGYGTGVGETDYLGGTSVFKEFVINMYYLSGTPSGDSLVLDFAMGNDTAAGVHAGSYYILDDLSFGSPAGVDDEVSRASGLEPICPNPASDKAEIIYNINSSGKTSLNIYDASGRLVKSLVNQMQSHGRYKAIADVADLPSGAYICKLSCGEKADVQKLIVQH